MALRFQADYFDVKAQKWRVDIYDANFSGTSSDIRLSGEGFVTKWEGSEETLYSGIMPSSTTLEVINEGGDMDVFLSQVANMDEGDVRIDVMSYAQDNTTSPQLWWSGILLIDGIQQEDAPTPSIVTFTATDDLAQLKTERWTYDLPAGYDPGDTAGIAYMIHRCLWTCRNRDAWSDNSVFVTSVQDIICEGYDESYLGSPGLDQFSLQRFSFDIGTSPNEINPVDGEAPAWFMWDILQSIAITFNMRIFLARGQWRAWPVAQHYMQADVYDYTDRVFGYQKDGDQYELNIGSAPYFKEDLRPGFYVPSFGAAWPANSENEGLIKLGGGIKSHSTPVKFVKRQQDWRSNFAIAQSSILYSGSTNSHVLNDMGDVVRMDFNDGRTFFAGAVFAFGGNVNVGRASSAYPGTNNTLIARIELVWDVGDYRWHGTSDGWTTDQTGSVDITIGQDSFTNGGVSIINSILEDTSGHPLPADSDSMSLTATLKLLNGYGGDITTSLITGAYNSPQTTCISVLSCTFADEDQGSELHFIAETSRNNKVPLDQGSVLIGSVQGSTDIGHIEGLAGISDANWRNDNHWESYRQDDADLDIHRLGVNEIAGTHEVGREIESGDVQLEPWLSPLTPLVTLVSWDGVGASVYDLDYWAPLTMSYNCASRTANVSRMRLDWDGGLDNISAPTGNLDGSFNPDNTETEGSIPGGPGVSPNNPMPQGTAPGTDIPTGGPVASNLGGKLSDVMDKTNAIEVDPGNGITAITIKSGETAFDADKVSQGTTNKFATQSQLDEIAINTAKQGTTLDERNKLTAISYTGGAISGFNFGTNTNVIQAEAIETDTDRQFVTSAEATNISDSKTKTDLISVTNGGIDSFNFGSNTSVIEAEQIDQSDPDFQFVTLQAKNSIGTDTTARNTADAAKGVTDLIQTDSEGITGFTSGDGVTIADTEQIGESPGRTFKTATEQEKLNKITYTNPSSFSVFNVDTEAGRISANVTITNQIQTSGAGPTTKITGLTTTNGDFNVEDGRLKMSHLTSDSTGITSITASDSVTLDMLDSGAFFGGPSGSAANRSGVTGDRVVLINNTGGMDEVADGNAGDFLKTNGSGVLAFGKVPGQGYHGSETRIKIGPSEFMGNDLGRAIVQTYIEDDTSNQLGLRTNQASAELFAFVSIPSGYKATHCHAYTSSAVTNGLKVHEYNTTTGALTNTTTGNTNTNVDITDITSSTTNMLVVAISPGSTTNDVFGAHVTIAST